MVHSRIDAAHAQPLDMSRLITPELLRVVLVLSGELHVQPRQGEASSFGPGDLFQVDAARIRHAQWSDHTALWLLLPAPAGLPKHREAVSQPVDALHAAALQAQLRILQLHHPRLSMDALETLLGALRELACLSFQQVPASMPRTREALAFQTAKRFLQAHCHRTDLDLNEVAHVVGCSRSALYRLFAAHNVTLAGYLRELRLHRCRRALALASPRNNIEQIAYRNGFADLHAFCRLFKQRFGMTPGQARGQ